MLRVKFFRFITLNFLLILILIFASTLRFVGTNPSYDRFHSDEGISYSAATDMVVYHNFDPKRYDYPALVPNVNYVFFQLFFIPISWLIYYSTHITSFLNGSIHFPLSEVEANKVLLNEIIGPRYINSLFWSRYITALFSIGNVLLTYFLAKKMFNKEVGLIAAFLLTFNFKHVQNAHIGLPDIYNCFTLLLFLLALMHLLEKKSLVSYLITGVTIGLSFSTKYQIFTILPFALVHLYNCLVKGKLSFKKFIRPALFGAIIVAGLTFIILNPYFFINLDKSVKQISDTSIKYALGKNSLNLYPFWYFYHIEYGPLELIAAGLGLVIALRKYFKKTVLLLSVLIPFFYVFLYYSNGGFYVRNFIAIAPLILIFAAIGILNIFNFIYRRTNYVVSAVILVTGLAIIVYVPGKNAIINSYFYTKPWNYDVLRSWEEKNLSGELVVASHPFDPVPEREGISRTEFELQGSYSLAEHRENGANFALMNLDWAGNPFYFWMNYGFDKVKDSWNKPYDLMRNSFWGLSAEELFRYQIFSSTKPWQAADANLVLAKLPEWPDVEMLKIKQFNFDSELENWTPDKFSLESFGFENSVGHESNGSITYFPGKSSSMNIRIISPATNAKPEHLYKVTGFIKADQELDPRQRDGFLRIDFYKGSSDFSKIGLISSVSSRVYGKESWVKKEVVERAPKNSKKLVVSWQLSNPLYKFWMDEITIEESILSIPDPVSKPPYNYKKIDLDLLYPNSHGNL